MTAQKKKINGESMVPVRKSVHVVFLSCAHCGNEIDSITFCDKCGEPMKVIDVVEKFGDDAERFLQRAKRKLDERKSVNSSVEDEEYESIDSEEPNIILMGDENLTDDDGGIDPVEAVDDGSLDVIFPDDGEDGGREISPADDDLTKALEQLDSEDEDTISAEDFGFDDGDIPEL